MTGISDILVEYSLHKNGNDSAIWELGADIPDEALAGMTSYGKLKLDDGYVYQMSPEQDKLISTNGGGDINLLYPCYFFSN